MKDLRFKWWTPARGHQWRGTGDNKRLFPLSGGARAGSITAPGGLYELTETLPGAFRKFAQLKVRGNADAVEDAILRFADEYGDILAEPWAGEWKPGDVVQRRHAKIHDWRREVRRMSDAVDLWDQSKSRSARTDLRFRIARALMDTETPSCATPTMTKEMRLMLYPQNLLAYMWLTFARVVSGEIQERPCIGKSNKCLGYVYVGRAPGFKRPDAATCSDACRKAKQRPQPHTRRGKTSI